MGPDGLPHLWGLSGLYVEMLFVLPEEQGHGYGKALVDYAVNECNIYKADVNEDNGQAFTILFTYGL